MQTLPISLCTVAHEISRPEVQRHSFMPLHAVVFAVGINDWGFQKVRLAATPQHRPRRTTHSFAFSYVECGRGSTSFRATVSWVAPAIPHAG